MTNIALTIDDETLAALRAMAEQKGVSVETFVAEALSEIAANDAGEDWDLQLTDEHRAQIRRGIEEAKRGEFMTQDEVRAKYERLKQGK